MEGSGEEFSEDTLIVQGNSSEETLRYLNEGVSPDPQTIPGVLRPSNDLQPAPGTLANFNLLRKNHRSGFFY